MTTDSQASDRRVGATFVVAQFVLLAVVVFLPGGSLWSLPMWLTRVADALAVAGLVVMVLAALGLGRGLTAMPLPNEHAALRTGGLYRWVRHPIYSGLLLFALCRTVVSGSPFTVVAFLVLVVVLTAKAHWEEQRLIVRFPDYAAYARRTGRFIPHPRHESP